MSVQAETITKKIYEIIDFLYGKIYAYNSSLLQKCNQDKPNESNFADTFDFYITSHAQSFLLDFYLDYVESYGIMMNARCILEGLAIKKLNDNDQISDIQKILLQDQYRIIEYEQYGAFKELDKICFDYSQFELGYSKTVELFKNNLPDIAEKELKSIISSNIPFLCNPKKSYRKIIEESLGEKYSVMYGLFSQSIHPNSNGHFTIDEIGDMYFDVLNLIISEYASLPKSNYSIEKELDTIKKADGLGLSEKYNKLTQQQAEELTKVSNLFYKQFGINYVSNTINKLLLLVQELSLDKILGLCEQVKCKWKILLEMAASFQLVYLDIGSNGLRYELLVEHTKMQFYRNQQQQYELEKAYNIYKQIYPNSCDSLKFENYFKSLLGFTINESGETKSLIALTKDYVNKRCPSEANEGITLGKAMLLDYVESQMLSHANGYMWYSNTGAWSDINNVLIATDVLIDDLLKTVQDCFKLYRAVDDTLVYKTIINLLRNTRKRIASIQSQKASIIKVPGVNK